MFEFASREFGPTSRRKGKGKEEREKKKGEREEKRGFARCRCWVLRRLLLQSQVTVAAAAAASTKISRPSNSGPSSPPDGSWDLVSSVAPFDRWGWLSRCFACKRRYPRRRGGFLPRGSLCFGAREFEASFFHRVYYFNCVPKRGFKLLLVLLICVHCRRCFCGVLRRLLRAPKKEEERAPCVVSWWSDI